jgi:hypothetical protein
LTGQSSPQITALWFDICTAVIVLVARCLADASLHGVNQTVDL